MDMSTNVDDIEGPCDRCQLLPARIAIDAFDELFRRYEDSSDVPSR